VRLKKELDEQPLDGRAVVADLVITRRCQRRMLEPVQSALAGERCATFALSLELAGQRRQHRVVAQLVMVDDILISERNAEHPLGHHRRNAVLDLGLDPTVIEAAGEPPHQADRPIGGAEQQRPSVRGGVATVEGGDHLTALDDFITEQVPATLCRHRGSPLRQLKSLWQKSYARFRAPMHLPRVRNAG
jgi:hypothetical protein